jgi:hypothetical protein
MHHAGHGSWMLAVRFQSLCDELVSLGQQRAQRPDLGVREGLHASHEPTIGINYAARLGMPDELQRPLFSCSPRSTIAPRVMWRLELL